MNQMPSKWAKALKDAYPERSGPCNWGGMRLMLALRKALMESTFQEVIDGCERYKKYCEQTGIVGTVYVQAPLRFIEGSGYLETFTHKAPEDPQKIEARRKEHERWERAIAAARELSPALTPDPRDSIGAFETRIEMQRTRGPDRSNGVAGRADLPEVDGLRRRLSALGARMRIS